MIKKLILFIYRAVLLSTLSGFLSNTVLALGLGDITVHSKLNEPLNVEIAIIDTDSTPLDDIIVRNAHRETYRRANLVNPEIFNKVHFKVVKKPNGSVIARITSKKPVKEPFITFIADLRWRDGHLNREYTFLLDPPKFVKKHSRSTYRSTKATPKKQKPAKKQASSKPARKAISGTKTATDYSHIIASHKGQKSYTTRRSDTLWKIAEKFRPDTRVTTWQTMQAIFILNQKAFINGDINLLKQHQTLTLPDSNEVRQLNGKAPLKKDTAKSSGKESYALNTQKSPSRVIEPQPSRPVSEKQKRNVSEEDQAHLKIIPPPETLLNKPVTSKKDLLLINKALKTSMDTIKVLQTENELLMAQVDSLNQKISNLDSHNVELNEKIIEITRLLKDIRATEALKNPRFNNAQSTQSQAPEELNSDANNSPVSTVESKLSTAGAEKPDTKEPAGIMVQTTAAQQPVAPAQKSLIQELITNPLTSIVLVVLVIIILLATYITLKKQKHTNTRGTKHPVPGEESILSSFKTADHASARDKNTVAGDSASALDSTDTESRQKPAATKEKDEDDMDFFEYFEKKINAPDEPARHSDTPQDEAIEVDFSLEISEEDFKNYEQSISADDADKSPAETTSIADVLSEVDTYIAYGNYSVAEDLLTSAIINAPLNKDLNLKLFECYALANKRYEFIQHVKQVINLLNENMVLRHRVENIYQQTWNESLDITQLS